jgi:hypothetical protein
VLLVGGGEVKCERRQQSGLTELYDHTAAGARLGVKSAQAGHLGTGADVFTFKIDIVDCLK